MKNQNIRKEIYSAFYYYTTEASAKDIVNRAILLAYEIKQKRPGQAYKLIKDIIKGKRKKTVNIFTPLLSAPPLLSVPAALPSSVVILRKYIYKLQAKLSKAKIFTKEKKFNLVWYLYYK